VTGFTRLNTTALGLICLAAIVGPLTPWWMQLVLIGPALVLMYFGLGLLQRDWNDVQEAIALQDLWRRQRERTQ